MSEALVLVPDNELGFAAMGVSKGCRDAGMTARNMSAPPKAYKKLGHIIVSCLATQFDDIPSL